MLGRGKPWVRQRLLRLRGHPVWPLGAPGRRGGCQEEAHSIPEASGSGDSHLPSRGDGAWLPCPVPQLLCCSAALWQGSQAIGGTVQLAAVGTTISVTYEWFILESGVFCRPACCAAVSLPIGDCG